MKAITLLTALYVTVLVLVPSIASKFVAIGPINVSGATLLFPITFILNDIFTEVYGYKQSRQIIWIGFLSQLITALAYFLVGILPAAPFWHHQQEYDIILASSPRITLASFLAYLCGEFANSVVLSKMKFKQNGARGYAQGMRFVMSTIAGEAIDSVIFLTVAFYGTMDFGDLCRTAVTIYFVKVAYEILALPMSTRLANFIKAKDEVDKIDQPSETHYSPFNLKD
jgi:queuosine precursor transporter